MLPGQRTAVPVIAATVLTVTTAVVMQPVLVYVMFEVPAPIPVATPVVDWIVALETSLLTQVPPVVADNNVEVLPTHNASKPVMVAGKGVTVTTDILKQAPIVYLIVLVPPLSPFTNPVPEFMVAIEVLVLLHTPPEVAELSEVVFPAHIIPVPVITAGVVLTVTILLALQPVLSV